MYLWLEDGTTTLSSRLKVPVRDPSGNNYLRTPHSFVYLLWRARSDSLYVRVSTEVVSHSPSPISQDSSLFFYFWCCLHCNGLSYGPVRLNNLNYISLVSEWVPETRFLRDHYVRLPSSGRSWEEKKVNDQLQLMYRRINSYSGLIYRRTDSSSGIDTTLLSIGETYTTRKTDLTPNDEGRRLVHSFTDPSLSRTRDGLGPLVSIVGAGRCPCTWPPTGSYLFLSLVESCQSFYYGTLFYWGVVVTDTWTSFDLSDFSILIIL